MNGPFPTELDGWGDLLFHRIKIRSYKMDFPSGKLFQPSTEELETA